MSLDLQLNTQQAIANLKALDSAIAGLRARFGELSNAEQSVAKLNSSLGAIKGIDPAAANSITAVANALNKLGKNNALSSIAQGLEQLGRVNVTGAAQSVTALANALKDIKTPRGLGTLGNNIAKIGNEARQGVNGVNQMAQALNGIKSPPSLSQLRQQLSGVSPAAQQASQGITQFGSAVQTAQGVLAAFGIQATLQGLRDFGKESLDASIKIDQFGTRLKAAGYTNDEVKNTFDDLNRVVDKLGLPLETSLQAFGKLASSMSSAGYTADQTKNVFEGFGTAFKALGLTAEQTDRAFNAVNQTFTKGTVSMEELRQQLGEVFPAFQELATSMGVSTSELQKLISTGKVSSEVFLKLASDMKDKFGAAAAEAAQNAQSAMIRFENALFRIKAAVGVGLFEGMKDGINALAQAMNNPAFQKFAQTMGELVGQGIGGLLQGITNALPILEQFFNGFSVGVQAIQLIAGAIGGLTQLIPGVSTGFQTFFQILATAAGIATPFIIAIYGINTAFNVLNTSLNLVKGVWEAVTSPMTRYIIIAGGVIAVVTALGIALNALYNSFKNGTSFTEELGNSTQRLGEFMKGVKDAIFGAGEASKTTNDKFSKLGQDSQSAGEGVQELGKNADSSKESIDGLQQPTDSAAKSMDELKTNSQSASQAMGEVNGNAQNAAGAVGSLGQELGSSAQQAYNAASAYREAAAAARELAAAKASANGGNTDSTVNTSLFSGGGISHIGTSDKRAMTASAFSSAPHFAGGTANTSGYASSTGDGGIPAVLHPNEAVVPLAGGGSIPISVNGAGGAARSGPDPVTIQLQQLATLREMSTQLSRTWESIDGLTIVVTNEFNKQDIILNNMVGALNTLTGTVNTGLHNLSDAIASIRVSSGGSSGGGGASGGGGGSSGGIGGLLADLKAMNTQIASLSYGFKTSSRPGYQGIGYAGSDGKAYASYDLSPDKAANDQIQNQINTLRAQLVDKYGIDAVLREVAKMNGGTIRKPNGEEVGIEEYLYWYKKNVATGHQTSGIGFATGSPNVFDDATTGRGAQVTIHPDEAVIPLPDGRSVPVSLPRSFQDRTVSRDNDARRPTINVTMNITTPDANSFRQSEQQIIDALRGKLERSARTLGPAKAATIEDPTRRV